MEGVLVLLFPDGSKLRVSGHRAEALAVLVLALVQDDGLEVAEVWEAGVHVTPGHIQPEINRLLKPQKRGRDNLEKAS
jgi:hypothetical protein